MEQITLGQIGLAVTFIVGLISGIGFLSQSTKKWITSAMKEQMESIDARIDSLANRLDQVDMEGTKNYLVSFLSKVERDREVDEIETERFWEQFQHYQKMGGNSYIQRKIETLKTEGKI
jgi:hypothetical protein